MKLKGTLVLVTGTTGFIGGRVARRLLQEGARVRALVRRQGKEPPGVQPVLGDMTGPDSVAKAIADVEWVVHCASGNGRIFDETRAIVMEDARHMAEAALAAGGRRFVYISTGTVYASRGVRVIDEETPLWPFDEQLANMHAVTKAEADRVVLGVAPRGLPAVILRSPAVLGTALTST